MHACMHAHMHVNMYYHISVSRIRAMGRLLGLCLYMTYATGTDYIPLACLPTPSNVCTGGTGGTNAEGK